MRRSLSLIITLLAGSGLAAAPVAVAGIVDVPVSFQVKNVNRSKVPCDPDGRDYRVVGSLVAPSSALANHPIPAATVYIHGSGGSAFWHFQRVAGYDYAAELAKAGHVSLALDLLGYGSSGLPDGNETCYGSDADVVSQVIAQLKAGSYDAGNRRPLSVGRVALAGHSGGGARAKVEAYSFPGNIDALVVIGTADGASPLPSFTPIAARFEERCAGVGEAKYDDRPSPLGYAYIFDFPQEAPLVFYNDDALVRSAYLPLWERDPCTFFDSEGRAHLVALALVPTISVPVLLVYGDHDIFSPQDAAQERDRYTGSSDVSLAIVSDAGHMLTLQRNAAVFRKVMSDWLSARGF